MSRGEQNIENIFNNAFDGADKMPPDSVWEKIEKQLDEASIGNVFKQTFENGSVEPPIGIWTKIQQNLWIRDFMRFTPKRVNIYYTSLVAVIAGFGLFILNNKQDVKNLPLTISKNNDQIIHKTAKNYSQLTIKTNKNESKNLYR